MSSSFPKCVNTLCCIVTATSLATGALASGTSSLPTGANVGDQDLSPFYRWSNGLPPSPGELLRKEALPAALTPLHAGSAVRILYTSEDFRWKSGIVPVSGALYLPRGDAEKGGWPLIVMAHGTVGMADSCAPSWAGPNARNKDYIDRWLAAGYAVVATDYQGLGGTGPEPYLNWQAEGRSVLDSARAALRADSRIANRMAITGQSQGSGASLGAARLADTYAPELKIKAAVATASVNYMPDPGTAPETVMPGAGAPHYVIYRMLGGGLPPGQSLNELLSAKGKLLLKSIQTECSPREAAERAGVTLHNAFTVPPEQINLMLGSAGYGEPFKVGFPIMIGTGLADELIPVPRQLTAVKALCEAGNTVAWKAFPNAQHGETLTRSFDEAATFVRSAMTGSHVEAVCKP